MEERTGVSEAGARGDEAALNTDRRETMDDGRKGGATMDLTTQDRLLKLIGEQLGKDVVRPEHSIREDLGADSLDTVALFMEIENEFNIKVPDETADRLRTVQDIFFFIEQYGRNR